MAHQVIVTEAGEELVVVPRREFDALLARLGDEQAEDRLAARMVEEHRRLRAVGAAVVLPEWLASAMIEGESALAAVRKKRGQSRADLSRMSGIGERRISAIEDGREDAATSELDVLSRALKVDPAWISP